VQLLNRVAAPETFFNSVAAPELSSLWVIGYLGMVPRFHGIQIASILPLPELQKCMDVFVCMYVCMYACMCMCMCMCKSGNKIRSCIFGSASVCFDCVKREQRKKRAVTESFLRVKFEVLEQGC
jgi:hypothetical protein